MKNLKKLCCPSLLLGLVVLLPLIVFGQIGATESLQIDSLCNEIDLFVEENKGSYIVLADVADDSASAPRWQRFVSDSLRREVDSGENLNQNATVWLRDGKSALITFTFQSPSRDWVQDVRYYYRPDGTLALAFSDLRTFYGNVRKIRAYWIATSGVVIDSAVSFATDLTTERPLKEVREYNDEPVPLFLTVSDCHLGTCSSS